MAGCYSPKLRDCELACANDVCPNGFECRDNVCRIEGSSGSCVDDAGPEDTNSIDVFPDGDPNLDTDNDMVNDAIDNCRFMANTDQANEDMDAFGDVCDPCPPYGSAADNADSDGDNVGDGCDPRPTQNGDRIALFVGFSVAPTAQEALRIGQTGAWTFANGRARVAAGTDQLAALLWENSGAPHVSAHMEIIGYEQSPNMPRGAGVVDAYDITNNRSAACVLGLTPNGTPSLLLLDTTLQTDLVVTFDPDDVGLGEGRTSHIFVHESASGFDCGSATSAINGMPSGTGPGTRVGLRARSITAEFDWLMVVDSVP